MYYKAKRQLYGNSEPSGGRLGSREPGVTDFTFGIFDWSRSLMLIGSLESLGLEKTTLSCSKGRRDVRAISEKAAPVRPAFYPMWSWFKQTSDLACDFSQVPREFSPLPECEGVEEALAGRRAAAHKLKCSSEDKTQRGQTMGGEPGLVNRSWSGRCRTESLQFFFFFFFTLDANVLPLSVFCPRPFICHLWFLMISGPYYAGQTSIRIHFLWTLDCRKTMVCAEYAHCVFWPFW